MADVVFGTSGSTGESKRIVRTEEALQADAANLVRSFPDIWGRPLTVVATVRPEHMYGALWRVRAPAVAGARVDPAVVLSVEELVSRVQAAPTPVLFVTTPSFLEKALASPDFALIKDSLADIVTSGSLLAADTSRAVEALLGVSPFEIYGTTETGSIAWRRRALGEAWTLCPGVSARAGADGALVADAPWMMAHPVVVQDAVVFESESRFRLGARLNRRVKILEKWVSLPAVEAVFAEHPLVARVRLEPLAGVQRLGALVVLAPEGAAYLASGTCAALAGRLRRDLIGRIGGSVFPRRIRFVRELPQNEQGKTTAAAVLETLSAWCAEPATLFWERTADALTARFAFPPDLACFKGHFPSVAILPGVAQIYFLRHFARQAFPDFPDACVMRRLKFQKIVTPNTLVTLTLTREAPGTFAFALVGPTGPCASGLIVDLPRGQ